MNLPKFGLNKFSKNTKKIFLHFFKSMLPYNKILYSFSLHVHDGSKSYHGFEIM